jgi:hypothetical protein
MIGQPRTRAEMRDIALVKAARGGAAVAVVCAVADAIEVRAFFLDHPAAGGVSFSFGGYRLHFEGGGSVLIGHKGVPPNRLSYFSGVMLLDPGVRNGLDPEAMRFLEGIANACNAAYAKRIAGADVPGDLEPWAVEGLPDGYGVAVSRAPGVASLWLTDARGAPLCRIPDALMRPRTAAPITHAATIAAEIWAAARLFQRSNEFAE